LGRLNIRKLISSVGKVVCSSAVMGGAVYFSYYNSYWTTYSFPLSRVVSLGTSILVGVGVFIFCSYVFKSPELLSLRESIAEGKRAP
jgi:hypothetical protein